MQPDRLGVNADCFRGDMSGDANATFEPSAVEHNVTRDGRGDDTRNSLHALVDATYKRRAALVIIPEHAEIERHERHVICPEARVDEFGVAKTPDKQSGEYQRDHGERGLQGQQQTRNVAASNSRSSEPVAMEVRQRDTARHVERGANADEHRDDASDGGGKGQDPPVDRCCEGGKQR